eukprot:Awhi_evm1s13102
MVSLLPEELTKKYASAAGATPVKEILDKTPGKVRALPGHYRKLVMKCQSLGMIGLQTHKPKETNGLFATEKDEMKQ